MNFVGGALKLKGLQKPSMINHKTKSIKKKDKKVKKEKRDKDSDDE